MKKCEKKDILFLPSRESVGIVMIVMVKCQHNLNSKMPCADVSPTLRQGVCFCMIPLTQGEFAVIDKADYDLVSRFKWRLQRGKYYHSIKYAATTIRYQNKRVGLLLLHHLILGPSMGVQVDHENHDGLDCRRMNLRRCTHQQNCFNRKPKNNSSSKYKGVSRSPGGWRAAIHLDGKRQWLGTYRDEDDAALIYNEAAKRLFGEFAYLNTV